MDKGKEIINTILEKTVSILKYVFKGIIFLIIGIMIAMPFILKNTSFKGDDLCIYKKNINIMSIEGKVGVKLLDSYTKTSIEYENYNNYIKSYNKSNLAKKTFTIELFALFILLETICLYYIVSNIIKLFITKEDNEYMLYMIKKSFAINAASIFAFGLIRRFMFRNTIFSSLNISTAIYYIFTIILFLVVKKIIDMNKVILLKEKKSEKYKKNN